MENHKAYRTVLRSTYNCKAAKAEMEWARDKIGRPNQSDTTVNSRRQAKKEQAEKRGGSTISRSRPVNPSQRLKPWHTTGRSGEN